MAGFSYLMTAGVYINIRLRQEGDKTMANNLQDEYDNQSADQSNDGAESKPKTLCGSACCYDCVALEWKITKSMCGCICDNIACCM